MGQGILHMVCLSGIKPEWRGAWRLGVFRGAGGAPHDAESWSSRPCRVAIGLDASIAPFDLGLAGSVEKAGHRKN